MAVVYAATAACLLRFDLDRLLFPSETAPPASSAIAETFRLAGHDGAVMIVRRLDPPEPSVRSGCVVFFPGREGGLDRYARDFFPDLERAGLVVYAVAWPGQDGAPGPARIDDVQSLAAAVVAKVVAACGRARTVVAGRSLGARWAP